MNVNIINDVMSPARECRVLRAGGGVAQPRSGLEDLLRFHKEYRFRVEVYNHTNNKRHKSTTPAVSLG